MNLRTINGLINCGDLKIHKEPIGGELHGFVYQSIKGRTHIFIDNSLSHEAEINALLHECGHVVLHETPGSYVIGIDLQRTKMESEAEKFAHKYNKRILLENGN